MSACRRGSDSRADTVLDRDLNLVSPRDSALMVVSPEERAHLDSVRRGVVPASPTRRSSVVRRSSGGEVARSSAPATTTSGGTRIVKHTKRDAAIGAAAGAVIGGATHGVKGAVVGGAAGGVLGAIIGNNVDKKKKKP
jgi:hypothetical protein